MWANFVSGGESAEMRGGGECDRMRFQDKAVTKSCSQIQKDLLFH